MTYEERIINAYGISSDLADAIVQTAAAVNIDPGYLADLMNHETNGTFSPSIRNPTPGSTATGLIQFIEPTAAGLGTSTAELADMTAVEQMVYVWKYFAATIAARGQVKTEADTYMAVFYPAAIGKPASWPFPGSVTAMNAATTPQTYVDAVHRSAGSKRLGRLLPASSSKGIALLGGALVLAAIVLS